MQFREILVDYDSAMATIHLFNRFLSLTLNSILMYHPIDLFGILNSNAYASTIVELCSILYTSWTHMHAMQYNTE